MHIHQQGNLLHCVYAFWKAFYVTPWQFQEN